LVGYSSHLLDDEQSIDAHHNPYNGGELLSNLIFHLSLRDEARQEQAEAAEYDSYNLVEGLEHALNSALVREV